MGLWEYLSSAGSFNWLKLVQITAAAAILLFPELLGAGGGYKMENPWHLLFRFIGKHVRSEASSSQMQGRGMKQHSRKDAEEKKPGV